MINSNKSENICRTKETIFIYEFLNFLEIFIHLLLYLRGVYPKEAFFPHKEYNLNFLKYIPDKAISSYITDFVNSLESLLKEKTIHSVFVMIINDNSNEIIELFNIDIDINEFYFTNNSDEEYYYEICNCLKSILHHFYYKYINMTPFSINIDKENRTFNLCIETIKEGKIINGVNNYNDISHTIKNSYIHNLIIDNFMKINSKNKEEDVVMEEENFCIKINHISI